MSSLYLDEERDAVESADDGAVVCLPGQDVESPDGSLDDLLHTDPVDVGALLLPALVHTGALRVLVGPDEELHDAGDGTVLAEGGVVSGAQGQVTDQSDHSLDQRPPGRGEEMKSFF